MTAAAVGVSASLLPGTPDMSNVQDLHSAQGHTYDDFQASTGLAQLITVE